MSEMGGTYSQHWLIQPLVIQPTRLIRPFPLDTPLTPYVKSHPKFDHLPNSEETLRVFFCSN